MFNACRAISNLRTSWLSREILFALLFSLSGACFAGLQWLQIGASSIQNLLGWLTAAFGFALVFCMAKIYTLRTVPVWAASRTQVSFLLTTLLSGVLYVSVVLTLSLPQQMPIEPRNADHPNALAPPFTWVASLILILIAAEFIYVLRFSARETVIRGYLHPPDRTPLRLKRMNLALLALGGVLILPLVFGTIDLSGMGFIFLTVFGLVMTAEISKRINFYNSRRPKM